MLWKVRVFKSFYCCQISQWALKSPTASILIHSIHCYFELPKVLLLPLCAHKVLLLLPWAPQFTSFATLSSTRSHSCHCELHQCHFATIMSPTSSYCCLAEIHKGPAAAILGPVWSYCCHPDPAMLYHCQIHYAHHVLLLLFKLHLFLPFRGSQPPILLSS